MDKINVAVIGTGSMGKNHARVYSSLENANLVALCDADKETVNEAAKEYKTKSFTDYKELLEKEKIDAVSLCVPTKAHKDIALDIIQKKVHVLIEKPIASTIEEAQEIIDAAKKENIKLMVGHVERFNPVVQEIKKRLSKKELGKIFLTKSERFSPFPKRVLDVGVTIDLSVHDIDIMHSLLGEKVVSVYGVNSQKIHSTNEDLMTSILKFKGGAIGIISCNWITPKIVRELTIIGEKGMFKADYLAQELTLCKNEFTDKYIDWEKRVLTVTKGDEIKINVEKKEPLKSELESFVACIKNNTDPEITGEEGRENLKIALQLLKSYETNEVSDL